MKVNMLNFNLDITEIPTYNDGFFFLYKIKHTNTSFPEEKIKKVNSAKYYYEELSLSDNVLFQNETRNKKIVKKIRIEQDKSISSNNVLNIDNEFYQVFNIYHFKNKDGFLQSDVTLQEYLHPKVEE